MTMRDLIPWGRNRNALVPSQPEETSPVRTLHRERNRLFDDFFRGFDLPLASRLGWSSGRPHVEVSETEKEVKVVAELPGMEEKAAVAGHHARLGTRLLVRLCRGRHHRRLNSMRLQGATPTPPGIRVRTTAVRLG